jgi:hypothetical protein
VPSIGYKGNGRTGDACTKLKGKKYQIQTYRYPAFGFGGMFVDVEHVESMF